MSELLKPVDREYLDSWETEPEKVRPFLVYWNNRIVHLIYPFRNNKKVIFYRSPLNDKTKFIFI